MQNRKKNIVKQIVSCDDEAITKLTWEEVLELLQTYPKIEYIREVHEHEKER